MSRSHFSVWPRSFHHIPLNLSLFFFRHLKKQQPSTLVNSLQILIHSCRMGRTVTVIPIALTHFFFNMYSWSWLETRLLWLTANESHPLNTSGTSSRTINENWTELNQSFCDKRFTKSSASPQPLFMVTRADRVCSGSGGFSCPCLSASKSCLLKHNF